MYKLLADSLEQRTCFPQRFLNLQLNPETMLFPSHLLIALAAAFSADLSLAGALLGAAFPDLVDKPLAAAGITETYHSVAHSGGTTAVLTASVAVIPGMGAFAVGHVLHILSDLLQVMVNQGKDHWRFLMWPLDFSDDPLGLAPVEWFKYYIGTRAFYIETVIDVLCMAYLLYALI